ncbi:hypothetical protein [Paenibacillus gallinarum]|nr:hypothetical protein [Paenibacillus gallinarum]
MIFGIEILNCEDIDVSDASIQYNGVTFLIDSLSKYDGMTIEVFHDWTFKIWDDKGNILETFFLIENDEFREKLYGMYPLK